MRTNAYIYILTNKNHTVLYTGVTSNLTLRLHQHQTGKYQNAFTSRYKVYQLVYYEEFSSINDAIIREKQIKAGSRQKKVEHITRFNPQWKDLSKAVNRGIV